jgi:hypothetical protein
MAVTSVHQPHEVSAPYEEHVRAPYRIKFSVEMAGFLTLLLGAWGGIVPYVGPVFGFSGDGTGSWTWSTSHALLFLIPGAAACLAGLFMMLGGLSRHAVGRGIVAFGAILAIVCGAWFIVGPLAWPALEGSPFFVASSPLHQLAHWIGYSLGPGALLIALGAFVLGRDRREGAVVVPSTGRPDDVALRGGKAPVAGAPRTGPRAAEHREAGEPGRGEWSTTPYAPSERAAAPSEGTAAPYEGTAPAKGTAAPSERPTSTEPSTGTSTGPVSEDR